MATTQAQEMVMYGETLEEKLAKRDAEQDAKKKQMIKQNIISFLKEGVEPAIISRVLGIDIKEVLSLQKEL